MKKLKRYIHRIKRHKRNKKISDFANNLYYLRYVYYPGLNICVHPLVYAIIRFRYPVTIDYLGLKEDSFLVKDYFDVITIQPKEFYYV